MEKRFAGALQPEVVNEVIAEAVLRPGWSQARLARALGLRPQTVNKWVSGENTPPVDRWPAIEAALEIPLGTFFEKLGLPHTRAEHVVGIGEVARALSGIDIPDDLDDDERAALETVLAGIRARREQGTK